MIELPLALAYDDVLLVPNRSGISSRNDVDLSWKLGSWTFKIPLISINMDLVTGVDMAISIGKNGGLGILPRFDKPDVQAGKVKTVKDSGVVTAAAIGVKEGEWERLEMLVLAGVDHVSIDVAHGHMERVLELIKRIRASYPDLSLSAGVVGTYEGAKDIFEAGADVVRVGVGPGTICTTRIMTGCGVPQITALTETARAAREMGKMIWADGGTKNSGDIVKGLAAGGSAVILGSQIAGTDEAPGEEIMIEGKKFKRYNASTSLTEKIKQTNKNSSDKDVSYIKYVEGVESVVPYSGPLAGVIDRLTAGVRSGYSYCGARNTEELWQKAKFVRISPLGARENGARNARTV